MAEDLDVDAMLEAAFQREEESSSAAANSSSSHALTESNGKQNGHSKDRKDRDSSKDRDRKRRTRSPRDSRSSRKHRSKSRDRKRSRSRDRKSSRSRDHKRSRSHDKKSSRDGRGKSRERRKSRDRRRSSREKSRRSRSRSRDRRRRHRSRSGSNDLRLDGKRELTVEERDARTVFCMQLSARIKARELEEFFSVVGKVTDVRIITDAKTRRSKGIAYVEFEDVESVPLALGLGGQKLLGVPIVVQPTLAERNRAANLNQPDITLGPKTTGTGPMRLYVGSLHFNITEEMLRGIFEPFGKIDVIQLIMDSETGRSKGYGFVTFHNSEDAKKALEQLNGFELAGRPMKVNHVTDRHDNHHHLDSDEKERSGVELGEHFGATQRLQLMAKLAEGTGLQLPQAAVDALHVPVQPVPIPSAAPAIATQCFLLSNMFDPTAEQAANWADEIKDDVIQECTKHGGVLHVFVDKQSAQGNVYVKCPSIGTAVASVTALHGRWFAGKMITAAYVPVMSYHQLFPDAVPSTHLLPMS